MTATRLDRDSDFEQDFASTVDRLEREQGRSLLDVEIDRLWEAAIDKADPENTEGVELLNLDKSGDRAAFIDRQMAGDTEEAEATERAYDLDNDRDRDRADYITARAAGEEFEDVEIPEGEPE